jgi:glycosyltransferase involved in cell wall biosynthesis
MIELPAFMIACSQTAEKLLKTLGRTENMEVCYPAVSFSNIKKNGSRAKDIRTSLHIPDDAFVWMMSGYFDYNKNPIRFIEIASELRKFRENVHFVWLGGKLDSGMGVYAKAKAAEMGMTKSISWLGPLAEEYYDYFDAADGFVLTSEKESFSIASVEAVYLQKPVVAFNCGGISEVIDRDSGVIVHSWNVTDIVKAMVDVMEKRISFDLQKASKQIQFLDAPAQVKQWETILAKHLKVTHPAQA